MSDTPRAETQALLRLLQLADSAFPAGAYAFSDGLETLVQRGEVRSADDLHAFLRGQLQQGWGLCDAPACALAWAGHDTDELLDLLKPVSGPRTASTRVGHNLHRAALRLWPELLADLSPASLQSLHLQGGPMTDAEARTFEHHAHYDAAVRLRRYDDMGKVPDMKTLDFEDFRASLEPFVNARLG